MKPYFEERGITIYHADCREVLPALSAESIITDPVWPNASRLLNGSQRPWELFAEMCAVIPPAVQRMAVQLGCCSDPRFLTAVPARFAYFRTCWLAFVPPSYRGRAIVNSDVGYVFGSPPCGGMVPGMSYATEKPVFPRSHGRNRSQKQADENSKRIAHPASRKLRHLMFLVKHFGGASVCDPFAGSFTTAIACKEFGIPFVGVEIVERFCEIGVKRLRQGVLDLQPCERPMLGADSHSGAADCVLTDAPRDAAPSFESQDCQDRRAMCPDPCDESISRSEVDHE